MTTMEQRYQRAEELLSWNLNPKLKNLSLLPFWIDNYRFWYKHDLADGYEFILVDSQKLVQRRLFDHQRLGVSLSKLLKLPIKALELPIQTIELCKSNGSYLRLVLKSDHNKTLLLDLNTYRCVIDQVPEDHLAVVSPDSRHAVIGRDSNLILRERDTGLERVLTEDGDRHYGYGTYSNYLSHSICEDTPLAPAVVWSPDGRFLAVQRIDERKVGILPLMQSVPDHGFGRPSYRAFKMALPGDLHIALASLCVIDLECGNIVYGDRPPVPASIGGFMECGSVCWGADGTVYYTEWTRDRKIIRLVSMDPSSGSSRIVIEERGQGYIHPGPLPFEPAVIRVFADRDECIWYSESSGWGHLYRYNTLSGELKNAITSGKYVVTNLHHVDLDKECIYFSACGREPQRNPYYEHLYRVNFDGTGLVLLTPEVGQHDVISADFMSEDFRAFCNVTGFSPAGDVFIDTYSSVEQPPRILLRSSLDGGELMTLVDFDEGPLFLSPYSLPLPFKVKATDDTTDLWGVIHKPSDFDASKNYPVILAIYGAPQLCIVPKRFAQFDQYVGKIARTLAELGIIVVSLDPRGTPFRSKAFREAVYGNMQNGGGIKDQIYALKQLGQRYTWLDLNRVGITGHSGGGFAAARAMLSHSDFFSVAVASAGNHDLRLNVAGWGEAFQGLLKGDNYAEQACAPLAKNLKGKLLLVHGDMDANVHLAHTLQLVDQLIENNKNFDLLILPNRRHNYMQDVYFIRRVWDYFVEYLLNDTPPKNYRITSPLKSPLKGAYCV